jgi:peptidoglycan/xylan/chitin deacetylase (PgdA/CDA1 family)
MKVQSAAQSDVWPGGKSIAVLVSILFETWSDGKGPSYFPRTTPLKPGTTDHGAIQWAQYGGNEGLWRILHTLDRHSVPATIFCSGRCGEVYPEVIAAAAKAGHDIAGHGYTQDGLFCYMTPYEERIAIRKTLDALEQASGIRAKGWATPAYSWTTHTFDLLCQEGVRWYGDALDISLPRKQATASGDIVAFPWSDFVDNRVLRGQPRSYYDVYADTFEYLREHEPMGLLHVAFHSHFGGRPLMTAMFDKLLKFLRAQPEVHFPGHNAIAQWVLEHGDDELRYASRFFA